MADSGEPKPQNYRDVCEGLMRKGRPCGSWDKEKAIDDGTDRNEVERDGGSYGSTNETQSERLGAPHYPIPYIQSHLRKGFNKNKKRTQEIIQDEVDWSDKKEDLDGHVKQALGLKVPPGDVIKCVSR